MEHMNSQISGSLILLTGIIFLRVSFFFSFSFPICSLKFYIIIHYLQLTIYYSNWRFLPTEVFPYLMTSLREHGHSFLFLMLWLSKTYALVNERGGKKMNGKLCCPVRFISSCFFWFLCLYLKCLACLWNKETFWFGSTFIGWCLILWSKYLYWIIMHWIFGAGKLVTSVSSPWKAMSPCTDQCQQAFSLKSCSDLYLWSFNPKINRVILLLITKIQIKVSNQPRVSTRFSSHTSY